MKFLALLLVASASSLVNADMVDHSTKFKLTYTVSSDDKIRNFGDLECKAKGNTMEDYTTNTEDCSSDGVCFANVILNTKLKYTCHFNMKGKTFLLGSIKFNESTPVIDDRNQNENVSVFKLEKVGN